MSKRVKITSKPISRSNFKPIDMSKVFEEQRKREEDDQIRYDKEVKEENERIGNLICPCCKSKDKKRFFTSKNNGIIGPGFHSHITNDYWICQSCGIHFSDLNKKEITKPYKGLF